ncbi:hypothetical protein ACFLQ2_00495 [archaeon]
MVLEILLNHNLHILMVLGGLFFLLATAYHLWVIRAYTLKSKFEKTWSGMLFFVVLFVFGYFEALYLLAYRVDLTQWLNFVLSFIFLVAAAFVLFILITVHHMLEDLRTSLRHIKALRGKQNELVHSIVNFAKWKRKVEKRI